MLLQENNKRRDGVMWLDVTVNTPTTYPVYTLIHMQGKFYVASSKLHQGRGNWDETGEPRGTQREGAELHADKLKLKLRIEIAFMLKQL